MICKKCGSTLPEDTTYCMNCNTWQNEDNEKTEETSSDNYSNEPPKNSKPKHHKFLVENENVIAKAKWTLLPFILSWGVVILVEIILAIKFGRDIYKIYLNNGYSLIINLKGVFITLIIITILLCAISILLFLLRRELVVTDKKIYGRTGIIATKQYIIPLDKINYISVRYSIITRILNSAQFVVYPGNSFWGIRFFFVAHANDFKKSVETAIYNNK